MTGSSGGQRILVVDDVEQMRTLMRRALSTHGYEVDVAATLTQARGLEPAGYDAVLVDANLGPERGIDLVEALRSKDPAAAKRCLVITGGAVDMLPDDVAYLTKPFQIRDLLEAVRALCGPDPAEAPDLSAGIAPDSPVQPTVSVLPGGMAPVLPGGIAPVLPGRNSARATTRRNRARGRRAGGMGTA